MKNTSKFMELIPRLNAIEFAGLARMLGVKLIEKNENSTSEKDKYIPRDFINVFEDVLKSFESLNRSQRRNAIYTLKQSLSMSDKELQELLRANNTKYTD